MVRCCTGLLSLIAGERMPWTLHSLMVLVLHTLAYVDSSRGRILPPVFWNASNAMFKDGYPDHLFDVNLGDRLDILCPYYKDDTVGSHEWEHYLIYMVEKESYDLCIIDDTSVRIPILNCSTPSTQVTRKVLIFSFQPVPGMPDFPAGSDYYFITTSGGSKFNLDNQYHGACKERNMKMILRVWETDEVVDTPTTKPPISSTTTTTEQLSSSTTSTTTSAVTTKNPGDKQPDNSGDGDNVPGSDGFPNDNTVIHAGEGTNINSGVIGDDGVESSAFSLRHECTHCFSSLVLLIASSFLLITMLRTIR